MALCFYGGIMTLLLPSASLMAMNKILGREGRDEYGNDFRNIAILHIIVLVITHVVIVTIYGLGVGKIVFWSLAASLGSFVACIVISIIIRTYKNCDLNFLFE
jgi:hypothetical protein